MPSNAAPNASSPHAPEASPEMTITGPTTSTTMPEPPALLRMPKLSDFQYLGKPFPADISELSDESTALKRTIKLINQILSSPNNDVAFAFLVKHKVVQRLFSPREVVKGESVRSADYTIFEQHQAKAMAYYILDPGQVGAQCSSCQTLASKGPFPKCLVPYERGAKAACTNCLFMSKGHTCSHRLAKEAKDRQKAAAKFGGLKKADLKAATRDTLVKMAARLTAELESRNQVKQPKTPKHKKRPAFE